MRRPDVGSCDGLIAIARLAPAVLVCVLVLNLAAQSIGDDFLIRLVRVFDGRQVIFPTDVLIQGGRVSALGKNLQTPAGVRVIDGIGVTLLPGLIYAQFIKTA
jgi:hypothetical protein